MGWWDWSHNFRYPAVCWIAFVMAGVFRKKEKAWSNNSIVGYAFHGTFAVLALWMFLVAVI